MTRAETGVSSLLTRSVCALLTIFVAAVAVFETGSRAAGQNGVPLATVDLNQMGRRLVYTCYDTKLLRAWCGRRV